MKKKLADLYYEKRLIFLFKLKLLQKGLIMLIQLVCLLSSFISRDVTLESCLFKCKINQIPVRIHVL